MTAGYEIQHNPTASSGTVAKGPGIVDHMKHEDWKFEAWRNIHKIDASARVDLFRIYYNVNKMYVEYAARAMKYKRTDHPKVVEAKEKFEEAKTTFEHYTTIAILSGHIGS